MKAHQDGRGQEHLTCKERLRDQGWFKLEGRWLQRDLVAAPHCLRGSNRGEGTRLFTPMHGGRVRVNRRKLKQEGFKLDVGKYFFSTGTVRQWLPREAVWSLSLEVFKPHLDKALI